VAARNRRYVKTMIGMAIAATLLMIISALF
jgi:hypothetical protein